MLPELPAIDTSEDWYRWTLGLRSARSWSLGSFARGSGFRRPRVFQQFNESDEPRKGFLQATALVPPPVRGVKFWLLPLVGGFLSLSSPRPSPRASLNKSWQPIPESTLQALPRDRLSSRDRLSPSQEGTGSMRRSACFLCRLISRDRLGNFIADEPLAFTVLQAWFSGIDRCHCHRHGGSSSRVSPGSRCIPGGYRAPNPTGNRLLLLLAFQRPQGDDSSGYRTCCRLRG